MKQSIFVLAILLLAGLSLAACQGNGEREKEILPELQLQPYKETAKANLTAYVDALDPGDYSEENWAAIESIAYTGKENIDKAADKQGVDSALAAALDEIGVVDKEHRDFILTISVEETTVMHGEDFVVNLRLKNQSGEDVEIGIWGSLFIPSIPNWEPWGDDAEIPPFPTFVLIKNGESFQVTNWILSPYYPYLEKGNHEIGKGNHELKFRAFFYMDWVDHQNYQTIEIWSNTVILTVQ